MIDYITKFKEINVADNALYPRNDIGTAKLFFDMHKDSICYVIEAKSWYFYSGKRWYKDEGGLYVMEFCKSFITRLHEYALAVLGDNEQFVKYAEGLHSKKRRDNILSDARSICPRKFTAFDKDKLLLNCVNGTFNLKTMTIQPHDPLNYITKLSRVHYAGDAVFPRWERFINEVMKGDAETARFLQKSLGYSLSGETSFECFFILHGGSARNGKSTTCETISYLLGEYAKSAQPEPLARRSKDGAAPSPDIARLNGARFVTMAEPERGLELNAALIKQLTGGDTYTGRFLHENAVEFIPEFKIFINTNHLPQSNDTTIFSSGRVKLIPFERHFSPEEQDRNLKPLFRQAESLSGIFNWLAAGYRKLMDEGLDMPQRVTLAVSDYKRETDITGLFLEDTLVQKDGGHVRTSELYAVYVKWAKGNGYRPLNNKDFVAELRRRYELRRNGQRGNEVVNMEIVNAQSV